MTLFKGWNALVLISSFCFLFNSANGLYCHVCSSDKLEQCSTFNSPEELPSELCPTDVTSCYTKIEHGITVRGCMSRQRQHRCTEDSCTFCRSDKCNDEIFPEDRLSCLHCEGSSCVNQTNTIEVRYPCVNYVPDDRCYSIFTNDGSLAYRGCMTDYNSEGREFCIENFAQCNECSKRGCNSNRLEFEKPLSCIKCEPDENSNCNVIDESTTAIECAPTTLGYKNKCYIHRNGKVSRRGCLYETSGNIFKECSDIFSDTCTTCNQTDCNRTPIVNTDLNFNEFHSDIERNGDNKEMNSRERYCFKCDSTIDPNCASELNDTMVEMCPYAERDLGCFHMITDSKVVRGCVVELNEIEKKKCMANDETCKTCFGASCNRKKNLSQCYVTDEPYTPLPLPYYTKASPKFCAKYNDQCFIQVLENDTVIRGCVEEYAAEHDLSQKFLSENVPDNKYQLCSEPLCNEKLDPIYCYSCDSSNSSCTKIRSDFQKQCPLEAKSSGCYHSIKGDYAERGCISELEGDTRTECQSDSEHCKKCIGNYCNNAKGFSRCLWSNQTDYIGVSRLCSKYSDLCITHASDSIRRGCLHDWIEEQPNGIDIKADCENSNICEKCSGQDCNKRFIGREYCLACSSSFECKHFVNEKMRVMCPFAVQSLGCYQRQDNVSSVERGCASSLNPMELSECQSTDSNCKTCLGDSCNNKISFTTCVDCSSEIDGDDCQNNTIFLKEQRCPNYSDQCYIRFENGVITRNCTDNVLVTPKECDKSRDCHLCTGNRCNGRIIKPEVCMVCDSVNDTACNSTTVLTEESYIKQCPLSLKEAGCFHYMNRNTEQHVRGCVAKLSDKDLILSHTNRWEEFRTCKGPKCNSEPTLPRCLVCDSREDSNCAIRPNATHSKVCDLYKNECFTLISAKSVVRGCFNDVDKDIRAQCLHDRNKCATYAATDIVGLNKKMVNDFDTCIACDSKTDPDCRSKPKAFKGKICDRIEPSKAMGCYLSIVGDHLTRGCIQDLNPEKAAKCLANSDTCKSCRATDCNSKTEFQECYSCNSQCDPLCARNVRLANTEVCKWYYSKCVTGIDRIGYIHRQCAEQHRTFEQLFSNQFQLCQGDKCNGGVYPANILQCFQCTGDDKKCDMTKNVLEPESCSIASVHDQCFTYIGPDKKVFRGCLSDATEQRLLCELVNEHKNGSCVKCDRSGCNKQPKFIQPKLSCMHCTDSEECAFGLRFSNQTMACKNPVVFGDEETCFTHSISGSTEVKRGCTLDANKEDDWCKEEDGCNTCSGSNCNYKNARYSWCVRCISDVNGRCAKTSKLDDYISQCVKSPYPFDKRGCYTNVKNGNVTRGCIADLSDEEYNNCNPQEKCTLCSDDKCNKEAIGSSSVKLSDSILMSFMILLAYLR